MAETPRRAVFDTLKGIGIVEVITHHCLGYSNRKFADQYSPEWWTMLGINRILHFAIPLFLLVSAALLTQSLMKRPDWGRFALRRATRTLWPYLLWSLVYVIFRVAFLRVGGDEEVISMSYPLLGTLTGPRLFVDLPDLLRQLVWGKAYFHLYFMVVLIQLAVALPFVILLFKRWKLSFGRAAILAGIPQLAVFLLQAWVLHVPTPASMVLWYMPSLLLGVWIGMNLSEFREIYARYGKIIWGAAALGLLLYLPMDFALTAGFGGNSLAFNSAFTLYSISVALGLFGLAPTFADKAIGHGLAVFGRVSLPMFLVHPAILVLMGGPKITALLSRLPIPALWTVVIVIGVSYGVARLAMFVWLDILLFGQRLPRTSRPQSVGQTVAA